MGYKQQCISLYNELASRRRISCFMLPMHVTLGKRPRVTEFCIALLMGEGMGIWFRSPTVGGWVHLMVGFWQFMNVYDVLHTPEHFLFSHYVFVRHLYQDSRLYYCRPKNQYIFIFTVSSFFLYAFFPVNLFYFLS
jgi:hypothetical protein